MRNKVLIIDDDEEIIEVTESMLKIYGFKKKNILIALNPLKGLELFKENKNSLSHVLCDYYMPMSNGSELCEIIKKDQPEIVVILQTGDHGLKLENLSYIDDILQKPFGYENLESILEKYEITDSEIPVEANNSTNRKHEERYNSTEDKVASFKLINKDLDERFYGIVLNQSQSGCCLALNITKKLEAGDQVKLVFGYYLEKQKNYHLKEEVTYEVIWTKNMNLDVCSVGFQLV